MLPNGSIVTDCYKEMVDGSAPKNTMFVDSSTIGKSVAFQNKITVPMCIKKLYYINKQDPRQLKTFKK